ncbi:MAG: HPr family phosphocarrier protein [Clostridiales bacterium]|nr:HPr family phosphocarrier protein [Clostridiales bacterium]
MITKEMIIKIKTGLEARPVALFVQVASQFDSSIYVEHENKKVNAKSIMGMMTLGLAAGAEVVVEASGNDEEAAISRIEEYLSSDS